MNQKARNASEVGIGTSAGRTAGMLAIGHGDANYAAEITALSPRGKTIVIARVTAARVQRKAADANAAFIVTAWNNHDALVSALMEIDQVLGRSAPYTDAAEAARKIVLAAIDKVNP